MPDLPACLECEPLTRAVVTGYAAKVTAEDRAVQRDAFIAAMVWGYGRVGYGPSRVERIMAQHGFEEQLADVTRITLEQGGPASSTPPATSCSRSTPPASRRRGCACWAPRWAAASRPPPWCSCPA